MKLLDSILLQKQHEVDLLKDYIKKNPTAQLAQCFHSKRQPPLKSSFKDVLKKEGLSVIAEIKRKSPSKGCLSNIENPVDLACSYVNGGASAISVLTDEMFFGGNLEDLKQVKQAVKVPVLRKDFVIDEIQIAQALEAGADAILLIVSVLKDRTRSFLQYASNLGVEALVEVHNLLELEMAIEAGAQIIGINHRDLTTFNVDMNLSLELVNHIPSHVVKVAESGVNTPHQARNYHVRGFDAVLIGEALVKANQPEIFISECRQ